MTKTLFEQMASGVLHGDVSDFTLAELEATPREELRDWLLRHALSLRPLVIHDIEAVERIAEDLIGTGVVPASAANEALHIAAAMTSAEIDVLVTWNCKHLANERAWRMLHDFCASRGEEPGFRMVTPPEALRYD